MISQRGDGDGGETERKKPQGTPLTKGSKESVDAVDTAADTQWMAHRGHRGHTAAGHLGGCGVPGILTKCLSVFILLSFHPLQAGRESRERARQFWTKPQPSMHWQRTSYR